MKVYFTSESFILSLLDIEYFTKKKGKIKKGKKGPYIDIFSILLMDILEIKSYLNER